MEVGILGMFQHIVINILHLWVIFKAIIMWRVNISERLTNGLPQDLSLALGSLWLNKRTESPHQMVLNKTS